MVELIAISAVWGLFLWMSHRELVAARQRLDGARAHQKRTERYAQWLELHLESAMPGSTALARQDLQDEHRAAHTGSDGIYRDVAGDQRALGDIRDNYFLALKRRSDADRAAGHPCEPIAQART